MYVPNRVVLVLLTVVGVSFVANAQQPAGETAPAVTPSVDPAPAPAAAVEPSPAAEPTVTAAPDAPAVVEIAPPAAPVAAPAPAPVVASPTPTVTASVPAPKVPLAFRGSSIGYSHSITALTLSQSAEGHYNPTWGHRLGFFPEWHFNDQLFARGRLYLAQEFTTSDTTTYDHEVEVSDIWLDAGAIGYTEPRTQLHLGGDVRFLLPTSKVSQSLSRIITVGPSLTLSRDIKLLHGLNVAYTGRFTYRFNRFTTGQNQGGLIANGNQSGAAQCVDLRSVECNTDKGKLNVAFDFAHGPNITFTPLEKLSFNAMFLWSHMWLAPMTAAPDALTGAQGLQAPGTNLRNLSVFALSASWQLTKPVSLTFGSWTMSAQPSPTTGQYYNPLFNRDTTLYLDATFDIEAAASSFL